MAAARGILLTCDKGRLEEFGGHVRLNRHWAHSLLNRMCFVQRRATTAKSRHLIANFPEVKRQFLDDVATTVMMEEIPPELVMNWDQTGIKMVPSSSWTMEQRGSQRVHLTGIDDKRQITAVFCGTLLGDFLPLQVIYKGKTPRCHPSFIFPKDWHISHSPKHWSTEETMVQYVENIIVPYVENVRNTLGDDKPALVIIDNFKAQITNGMNRLLESHDIHVVLLPPNTTDVLQPMDNKPAKNVLKEKFHHWYSEQITKQLEGKDIDTVEIQPVDLSL